MLRKWWSTSFACCVRIQIKAYDSLLIIWISMATTSTSAVLWIRPQWCQCQAKCVDFPLIRPHLIAPRVLVLCHRNRTRLRSVPKEIREPAPDSVFIGSLALYRNKMFHCLSPVTSISHRTCFLLVSPKTVGKLSCFCNANISPICTYIPEQRFHIPHIFFLSLCDWFLFRQLASNAVLIQLCHLIILCNCKCDVS